jgi:ribosomal protein S18 acetylase RimI-like enzyme
MSATITADGPAYRVVELTQKEELDKFFTSDNKYLHLYEIGDLDDFFWPHTRWFALQEGGVTKFVALLYSATSLPVLLAFGSNVEYGSALLTTLLKEDVLPSEFYSHLSVGLREVLEDQYAADYHGRYWKMGMMDHGKLHGVNTDSAVQLLPGDVERCKGFYAVHYPGNWFDQRMLDSLQTYGILDGTDDSADLIAIAGIHVFSKEFKVASLGNIAVHTEHRGRGLARTATAALLKSILSASVEHIGLNVSASNAAAIKCYTGLGFEKVGEYDEVMWTRK